MKTVKQAMNTKQQGFTLIELVVVIVILGILAAVAVPRFVNLQGDARLSVMQGVQGAMQSGWALAYAQALARNQTGATGTIVVEGQNIALVNGYPSAASIQNMINLQPPGNFTITSTATTLQIQAVGAATPAQCQVLYTQSTGANIPPTVQLTASQPNC